MHKKWSKIEQTTRVKTFFCDSDLIFFVMMMLCSYVLCYLHNNLI